ncbi:bifunctional metallophosphatase/5'-nucleotidase [Vagococcus sp. WN89Y]|uniref:bifunctional metallophosphatase/5'-nucleotidase n=1 Tax=Vagococcus sp. WN89Y TaxID=3457258 RepID=UPI003FCD8256
MSSFALYASEMTLTVFHTGDTHGRGMSAEGIGYGKMSGYVKAFRKSADNVLFLDVGDAVSGVPVSDLAEGATNINAMNTMGYDAFTPGNADFVFGGQNLLALHQKARFPFISANVWFQGKLVFEPFIIKKIGDISVGIIGVSPLNAMVATTENKLAGFLVSDPIIAVKDAVEQLKNKVDVIVLLAHLGKTDVDVNINKLAAAVPDIDIIIDGHDHIAMNGGAQLGNSIMVNAGQYGDYLGQLTLTIKDKKIIAWNERLLDKNMLMKVAVDKQTQAYIDEEQAKSERLLSRVVMALPWTLDGKRERVRSGQTSLGSVLADAEREYAQADVAFTVGAFLRDSIEAGPVSYGQVLNAVPFTLPLVTREMSGRQIRGFLEHNYRETKLITGAYAHVSGLTYMVDYSLPVGQRMKEIKVNGMPLDPDKLYRVACNEQVSDYGIRDIKIKDRYDVTMASLLTDYVNNHPVLSTPDTRIRFINSGN